MTWLVGFVSQKLTPEVALDPPCRRCRPHVIYVHRFGAFPEPIKEEKAQGSHGAGSVKQADLGRLLGWRSRVRAAEPQAPADPGNGPGKGPELGEGVRCYHLRHSRERAGALGGFVKRPRHLLVYRLTEPGLVGVGRVLHDSMELAHHRPRSFGVE